MEYLKKYRKILSTEQMTTLMKKSASNSPLWLIIACEELRVFGEFRDLDKHVADLKENLPELVFLVLFLVCLVSNIHFFYNLDQFS